jgi:hypothetical protein
MEFKGTKGKWECIFTSDLKRAIRTNGGILMTFWKPMRYSNQDERYELELKETQANQLLCSKAPIHLQELQELFEKLSNGTISIYNSDGGNISDAYKKHYNKLIEEATEI